MAQKEGAPAGAAQKSISALAEPAARFVIGFTLSNARITGGMAPFGTAFAGAAPQGLNGAASTLGAALGYLAGGELMWAVKYIATIVLIRAALFMLAGTGVSEHPLFPAFCALAASLGVGFVYVYDGGWGVIPSVYFAVESFLTAGCTFFFSAALSPWERPNTDAYGRLGHMVCSVILLAALLMALSRVLLFGTLSVGRALAVLAVMLMSLKGGVGTGCAFAAAVGASMDLALGTSGVFTAAYTLSALTAGLFSKNGRLVFSLAYIAANAICVIWTRESYGGIGALFEAFAASVIFLLLPASAVARLSSLFPVSVSGYGFLRAREYTRRRIELMISAFGSLAPPAGENSDSAENPAVIFDRAAAAVCSDCPDMPRCWQAGFSDTADVLNNVTPRLLRNGRIDAGDLPSRFTDRCLRLPRLLTEINAETRALRLRREYRSRLAESRRTAVSQYAGMAALLSSVSSELGGGVAVDTACERRLAKYLKSVNVSASVAVFRLNGERLRAEIEGEDVGALRRGKDWLEKLSEVLGTRLCTPEGDGEAGKLVLLEAEPVSIAVGVSSAKKNGARVSGDKSVSFRTDDGTFYVILSDGMGSGESAHELASAAVGALRSFLTAGVPPEPALGFVENSMFLKNISGTGSATIDLMSVDMFTGEAKIYKYGAAPTYLKKGNIVRRVTSSAFPAGLASPSDRRSGAVRLKLPCGSFAVLISDGVISGSDDRWLRKLIAGYTGGDPVLLSKEIIERARLEASSSDDMTVLAVKVDARQ